MRGQRAFKELIKVQGQGKPGKGRNDKLVNKRNDCLLARYLYYGSNKHMYYEEIIRQLVAEFFLSPSTIAQIIVSNTDQLQALKQKAQVTYYFQNHWPHFRW